MTLYFIMYQYLVNSGGSTWGPDQFLYSFVQK